MGLWMVCLTLICLRMLPIETKVVNGQWSMVKEESCSLLDYKQVYSYDDFRGDSIL